jgi:methionine aminopeptidase
VEILVGIHFKRRLIYGINKCCGGTANASACFIVNSKTYGFTSIPFQLNKTSTNTIWEAIGLPGLSGTVVIIGNIIAGTTRVAINGLHTTQITDNETFAISSNPLCSVVLTYTSAEGECSSFTASISAARFEY